MWARQKAITVLKRNAMEILRVYSEEKNEIIIQTDYKHRKSVGIFQKSR